MMLRGGDELVWNSMADHIMLAAWMMKLTLLAAILHKRGHVCRGIACRQYTWGHMTAALYRHRHDLQVLLRLACIDSTAGTNKRRLLLVAMIMLLLDQLLRAASSTARWRWLLLLLYVTWPIAAFLWLLGAFQGQFVLRTRPSPQDYLLHLLVILLLQYKRLLLDSVSLCRFHLEMKLDHRLLIHNWALTSNRI